MTVVVLTKTGCGKCHAASDKLRRLRVMHLLVPMDNPGRTTIERPLMPGERPEGDWVSSQVEWRDTVASAAIARAAGQGFDITKPPVLVIDGTAYDYPGAMRVLKGM